MQCIICACLAHNNPYHFISGNSKNGETNKQAFSADSIFALDKNSNIIQDGLPSANDKTPLAERSPKDISDRENSLQAAVVLSRDQLVDIVQKLAAGRSMEDCVELLAHLDIQNNLQESE